MELRSRLSVALAAAVAVAATVGARAAGDPPLPGPAQGARVRHLPGGGAVDLATCATCHEEISREWKGSLHRAAWSDPVFLKAYDLEPKAFCRGCHAPEGDPAHLPSAKAQDEGVSCATCHVEGGAVVGSKGGQTTAHPIQKASHMEGAGACVRCHQFDFPPDAHQRVPSPMQNTVAEWRASSLANKSCQDCHMPRATGKDGKPYRSHGFHVLSDPAVLQGAIEATARRTDQTHVEISLRAADVGHAFPTGDMFRRLQVRAAAVDVNGRPLAEAQPVELARTFKDVPVDPHGSGLGVQRVEGSDTRLAAPGTRGETRRIELHVKGAPQGAVIRWEGGIL